MTRFAVAVSIVLEAQRLGLRAIASDLNPLPVIITKALTELPLQFHNRSPVNPEADPLGVRDDAHKKTFRAAWRGAAGLAVDIRHYGAWMRNEAYKRIGHLYPKVQLRNGNAATVVAWLWAQTVACANPACGIQMPLMKTFQLSKKTGNEHWIKPVVDGELKKVSWIIQTHPDDVPAHGTVNRNGATCVACGSPVKLSYIREQGKAARIGETLTAIVAEGETGKLYLPPTETQVKAALRAEPTWKPLGSLPQRARSISPQLYGFTEWHTLFTNRQTTVLNTFGVLLPEVRDLIRHSGADSEYADAVCTYLALAIGRTAESGCKAAWWDNATPCVRQAFTRQGIQMTWAFAEANPFPLSTQNWSAQVEWIAKVIDNLPSLVNGGIVYQADAATTACAINGPVIVTDPPYYDNIHYADSSDFFYVWLRPLFREIYPNLFGSMMTPKEEEIVANQFRFDKPNTRFEKRLSKALLQMRQRCSDVFPTLIMYAYKQHEQGHDGKSSTGWETMLTALVNAGFQIVCTWPMRTEQTAGIKRHLNSLASSILLICRPRPEIASFIDRRTFLSELAKEMPIALDRFTRIARINPVDLAQAAIGPGMEVYSRYSKVIRVSGEPVTVREALIEINNQIDFYHEEETGELDSESQFCLTWMRQHGYIEGAFGDALVLATAKGVDIGKMHNKLLSAERGQVHLLTGDEISEHDYSEEMCTWEACTRMAWHLEIGENRGGIQGCVSAVRAMGSGYESVERLARLLYNYYENRGDSQNAVRYNSLVTEWRIITEETGLNTEQLELT